MRQVSNLPEQVIESQEISQIQPTKKPKRIFSKLVLVFGILGEFYLALFWLARYLDTYANPTHHQTAMFIEFLLGLKEVEILSSPTLANDGLFVCTMYVFYLFFLVIPTLRLFCFLCFIYICLQFLLSFDNDGNKKSRLLIAVIIVWLIYYLAFFQSFSSRPFDTTYSWPLTPWMK